MEQLKTARIHGTRSASLEVRIHGANCVNENSRSEARIHFSLPSCETNNIKYSKIHYVKYKGKLCTNYNSLPHWR